MDSILSGLIPVATARGIVSVRAWRQPLAIAWRNVAKVHFSRAAGYLVLTGKDATKVKVSPFMTGFEPFLDVVLEQLGHEVAGQAVGEAREYAGRTRGDAQKPPLHKARASR